MHTHKNRKAQFVYVALAFVALIIFVMLFLKDAPGNAETSGTVIPHNNIAAPTENIGE